MAVESLGLTRPSLQLGQQWPWCCASVVTRDCVRHNQDEPCDIRTSSLDSVRPKPAGRELGCLGNLDQFEAYVVAIVVCVHAGRPDMNNRLDAEIADAD